MQILTDIYPPEIKPVRDGLYLCFYVDDSGATSIRTLQLWDGALWRYESGTVCFKQEWHWTGLAFDPESSSKIRRLVHRSTVNGMSFVMPQRGYWIPEASDDQPA
jgi:hypothetical protein